VSSQQSRDARHAKQTSFYLVRRAEALLGALQFFAAPSADTRRKLQFLAQSDFWEWELDNLIFSFTNLAERQETWRSARAAVKKLGQVGVVVDAKVLKKVRWRDGRWGGHTVGERVAPVDLLRDVLRVWNELIDDVERRFVTPMRDKAEKWSIQARPDLNSLRRAMPGDLVIKEDEDEED
jgi:hypothetical protein